MVDQLSGGCLLADVRKLKKNLAVADSDTLPERQPAELAVLLEVSQAVMSSLDLDVVFQRTMNALASRLGMKRGTLTLLDTHTNELVIRAAHGLTEEEIRRGRYKIGEGVTGRVMQTARPMIVPNIGREPLFLDRTKARGDIKRSNISFICVPLKIEDQTIGVLSVDRLFADTVRLDEDVRVLTIVASFVAQAVKIHEMIESERARLEQENRYLRQELKGRYHLPNVIGSSEQIQRISKLVLQVAPSKATVLLRGESGTGKELIARAIHYNSPRAEKPFVAVSCAALPESLLESELFGYEPGAFTGATSWKAGRFEMANHGTLFLDEVGDLSPATQAKLLRVLQERKFERLGGTHSIEVEVRVIAATERPIEKMVAEGSFREALYYRLDVISIRLPLLRERREDIPLLAHHFLRRLAAENEKEITSFSEDAMEAMLRYDWPGNVRELENCVERAVVVAEGPSIRPSELRLGLDVTPAPQPAASDLDRALEVSLARQIRQANTSGRKGSVWPDTKRDLERRMIEAALLEARGIQTEAARLLGMNRNTLRKKIVALGLDTAARQRRNA